MEDTWLGSVKRWECHPDTLPYTAYRPEEKARLRREVLTVAARFDRFTYNDVSDALRCPEGYGPSHSSVEIAVKRLVDEGVAVVVRPGGPGRSRIFGWADDASTH